MGTRIAQNIRNAIDNGFRADQVAVLVRLYAETGAAEMALIEEGIPTRSSVRTSTTAPEHAAARVPPGGR